MITLTIQVPRINDSQWDYAVLARMWGEVMAAGDSAEVRFDFSRCDFLRPNAVVFLGGLARLIRYRGGRAHFDVTTMQVYVRTNLEQNGFAYAMWADSSPWKGNSIPYREDLQLNEDGIVEYLKNNWLGCGWVNISHELTNAIASQMWEVYANAFEHSGTRVGVLSCGQYFKQRKELVLAVVDFGVGIPSNARFHTGNAALPGGEAMRWAFTRGTSTAQKPGPRGMGLDLLKEFVRVSQGVLAIYSHDGYACIDSSGEIYQNSHAFFEGTLAQVTLRCDGNHYALSNETNTAPYF